MSSPDQKQNRVRLEEQVWGLEPPRRPERTKLGRLLAILESLTGGGSHHWPGGHHDPRR